jgi:iron transport multicopper oxidase
MLSYNASGGGAPRFELNGYSFAPTKYWQTPVLLQILSGARSAQEMLPPGSVYTLPPNASVEVSFSSAGNVHGFPVSQLSGL